MVFHQCINILDVVVSLLEQGMATQGLNPGVPHCRQTLYQGSPKHHIISCDYLCTQEEHYSN